MGHDRTVAVLFLAVVLAGCASAPIPGSGERIGGDPHPGTPVATQQTPETAVPTAEQRPNPWNDSTLVVAVDTVAAGDRDVAGLVQSAAAFWSDHSEPFAGYAVDFVVERDAEDPDVVVRFVDTVTDCEDVSHAAGCAPLIDDSGDVDRPETVTVLTGLSNASTEHVVRHEFGHLLGVEHGEPPREVMRPNATIETLPRPNATDRAFPWPNRAFAVFLGSDVDAGTEHRQVEAALDYYERAPAGMPANLTFRVTENRSAADVVVRRGDCGAAASSCFTAQGPDPDGDGAIEQYHRAAIGLDGVPDDAVGWHVGNWLAYVPGAESAYGRPPPFRNADTDDRRSEWWDDD